MFTIGPWWLYDTIIVLICFFILYRSIRNGLFVGLYFTIFSLFIYLILTFIPQLIANALAPFIIGAVRKLDGVKKVIEVFDAIQDQISGALTSIFAAMGQSGSFSITNFGLDALTAVIALVLYVLVFFLLAAILMLTMIICYFIFANKLKSAKINKYVSKLVGGVFGAFIAIFYASTSAMLLSMPIFDYSSQRFGVPITPGVDNSGRFIDSVKNGNQYSRYALSGQFNNVIPAGAITLSYSSSCAFKYIVAPIISGMTALQNMVANEGDQAANLQEAFGGFTDTVISGYASNNILDLPVKQCIQVLPIETQNFVRMFTEFIMNASILTSISNTNVDTANIGQAGIMFDQMDRYKVEKKLAPEYRFDQKTFIDFFNWSKTQPEGNQFLRSVAVLNAKKGSAALQSIFSNGDSAYSFMRNVYEVNVRIATSSSIPILPSVLTSLSFMPGLDIIPSGVLAPLFGATKAADGSLIDGDFELKNYMDYINAK